MVKEADALTEVFEPSVECRGELLLDYFAHGRVECAAVLVALKEANAGAVIKPKVVIFAAELAEIGISNSWGRRQGQGDHR